MTVNKITNASYPSTIVAKINEIIQALGSCITSHQTLKTINGESLVGSGNVEISSTIQEITTLSAGVSVNVALDDNKSIFKITPNQATTFTFTNSTTASLSKTYTFELYIDMPTVYALTFPSSVTWQDNELPSLEETGTYFLAFRTVDGGSNWIGNLQGRW